MRGGEQLVGSRCWATVRWVGLGALSRSTGWLTGKSLPGSKAENGGKVGAEATQTAPTFSPPSSRGRSVIHARPGSDERPGAESTGARPKTVRGYRRIKVEKPHYHRKEAAGSLSDLTFCCCSKPSRADESGSMDSGVLLIILICWICPTKYINHTLLHFISDYQSDNM